MKCKLSNNVIPNTGNKSIEKSLKFTIMVNYPKTKHKTPLKPIREISRLYRCLWSLADSRNSTSRCLCWIKAYIQLQVRATETYKRHQITIFLIPLNQIKLETPMKSNKKTYRIICKEIKRSRKPKCNKRLIQILDTMVQVPNISKCILSETQSENPRHENQTPWSTPQA